MLQKSDLVLYSFRRCPYAIRARMALSLAGVSYEHREVSLKEKPSHMLEISPKGTVPVLFSEDFLLEESLDIVLWAFSEKPSQKELDWVKRNDTEFKKYLDICKYKIRFSEEEFLEAKKHSFSFLEEINKELERKKFLSGGKLGFLDLCLFPFARQFSRIKPDLLGEANLPCLKRWLEEIETSSFFENVMKKHELWKKASK